MRAARASSVRVIQLSAAVSKSSSSAKARAVLRPSNCPICAGGMPPPGHFMAMSASVSTWPAGRSRAAKRLLPIFLIADASAGRSCFTGLSERDARALEVAHHLWHADRLERKRVVSALPGVIEREMFFDDAPAKHVSGDGHDDAVRVVGKSGDDFGKTLATAW